MRLRRGVGGDAHIEALLTELGARVEPPTEDELRDLARSVASTPRALRARRRPYGWQRWVAGATTAVLIGIGVGFGLGAWSTEEGSARTSFFGVGFVPAQGWSVVQSTASSKGLPASSVAANVPLPSDDDPEAVVRVLRRALPARGILIFVTFSVRGDPGRVDFVRGELPLSIDDARMEGRSAGAARYRLRAGVGAYNVDARLYFGSPTPSTQTKSAAQSQLNRLVVASERVTIFARPAVLRRDERLTLFGSADTDRAEEIVTIEAKDCGQSSFRGVAAARTRQGGGWSTDYVNPGITATFRAIWNDNTSTTVAVRVRPYVQLRKRYGAPPGRFTVGVGGKLQFWRRHVVVERFERRLGTWRAVKKVMLTETGSTPGYSSIYSFETFTVSLPKGTLLRAVFPLSQARPCYLAGYSNQLRT